MRNKVIAAAAGLIVLAVVYPLVTRGQSDLTPPGAPMLTFQTMVPVTGPYVGNANPIRTLPGGGKEWQITKGIGTLEANGQLTVQTQGLVLVSTGTNPIEMFRAVVSCRTINGSGMPDIVNVSTDAYPADARGNSQVTAKVDLPSPCIAPIIFVTSTGGAWFAVGG